MEKKRKSKKTGEKGNLSIKEKKGRAISTKREESLSLAQNNALRSAGREREENGEESGRERESSACAKEKSPARGIGNPRKSSFHPREAKNVLLGTTKIVEKEKAWSPTY